MRYEQIKLLEEEKFRRLTGVKKGTFEKIVSILQEAEIKKKARGGRKSKLSAAQEPDVFICFVVFELGHKLKWAIMRKADVWLIIFKLPRGENISLFVRPTPFTKT